jgi:hypothetical protein
MTDAGLQTLVEQAFEDRAAISRIARANQISGSIHPLAPAVRSDCPSRLGRRSMVRIRPFKEKLSSVRKTIDRIARASASASPIGVSLP